MKTIIAGSRSLTDYQLIDTTVKQSELVITEVVCGEAPGIDRLGKRWAREHNTPVVSFPADWNDTTYPDAVIKYNRHGEVYDAYAGKRRNEAMAVYADALIAIWDGRSKGTLDMIERAYKHDLHVYIMLVF